MECLEYGSPLSCCEVIGRFVCSVGTLCLDTLKKFHKRSFFLEGKAALITALIEGAGLITVQWIHDIFDIWPRKERLYTSVQVTSERSVPALGTGLGR